MGVENVVGCDMKPPKDPIEGEFRLVDITDKKNYEKIIEKNKITSIIHMAALLWGKSDLILQK